MDTFTNQIGFVQKGKNELIKRRQLWGWNSGGQGKGLSGVGMLSADFGRTLSRMRILEGRTGE